MIERVKSTKVIMNKGQNIKFKVKIKKTGQFYIYYKKIAI